LTFFKRNNKRKNKLLHRIDDKGKIDDSETYSVDINDTFVEQSTSPYTQFKKLHWSFLDIVDNTVTSLVPHSILVIEILDDVVNVAILAKKGVFLDIKYLKKYSFEDLHMLHQRIISKEVEFDRSWYEEFENIVTIVSYDIIYTIPSKVVIVENRFNDFYNIQIKKGRFLDKAVIQNTLNREFESLSGYSHNDVYMTVTQRSGEKKDEQLRYMVSACEKEYFDRVEQYLNETDFSVKKMYSLKSAIYLSFFVDKKTKMRLHIEGSTAYMMQKYPQIDFEFQQLNLETDLSVIETVALSIDETILSGSGKYYEQLKKVLFDAKVPFRVFNFTKDLNRSIIRLEEGVFLDNGFATIITLGYHELFEINFSAIRLGVGKRPSFYDHLYNNIIFLPFVIVILVAAMSYGAVFYVQYKHAQLQKSNLSTSGLVYEKSQLEESVKKKEKDTKNKLQEIQKIQNILDQKKVSEDAVILDEVAAHLPDDMILTKIEKQSVAIDKRGKKKVPVIFVTGKAYFEHTLVQYIQSIQLEDKKVYLKSLQDDKKSRVLQNRKGNETVSLIDQIENEYLKSRSMDEHTEDDLVDTFVEKLKEMRAMNLEEKEVFFGDTLNNTFILEIK